MASLHWLLVNIVDLIRIGTNFLLNALNFGDICKHIQYMYLINYFNAYCINLVSSFFEYIA